jgi:hypothetical protein
MLGQGIPLAEKRYQNPQVLRMAGETRRPPTSFSRENLAARSGYRPRQAQIQDHEEPIRYRALFTEGDIYTIHDQIKIRKENQGFKYFRLKYWDGHNWIVRFIKADDTDWIALTENRIADMIYDKVIERAPPEEQLDAIIMEGKNEAGGWKFKFSQ